jgi:glycosyltransferase involved in cell wall biosynthesis
MRILALTRYGTLAASTRQRFVAYVPALAAAGMDVDFSPLLANDHLRRLVAGAGTSWLRVAGSYTARLLALFKARRYDLVWVHCELFPYLPGGERLAAILDRPVVFDFDDAIFHYYDSSSRPWVRRLLGRKLEPLLRRAAACTCGNDYLREYASRFCERSLVVPTVVDTSIYRPRERSDGGGPPTIGWIGSPSTWVDVRPLLPLFEQLHRETGVRFRAVGAGAGALADQFEGLDLVDWTEATEVSEVQRMDIGIMPVRDLPFQRGKSGYKLVQYMACGLPVVASPVGVNCKMVTAGDNGFLAADEAEWRKALLQLIGNAQLRDRMGDSGRKLVEQSYSLASQAPRLVELFKSVAAS